MRHPGARLISLAAQFIFQYGELLKTLSTRLVGGRAFAQGGGVTATIEQIKSIWRRQPQPDYKNDTRRENLSDIVLAKACYVAGGLVAKARLKALQLM